MSLTRYVPSITGEMMGLKDDTTYVQARQHDTEVKRLEGLLAEAKKPNARVDELSRSEYSYQMKEKHIRELLDNVGLLDSGTALKRVILNILDSEPLRDSPYPVEVNRG